jgi:hypothetical protein
VKKVFCKLFILSVMLLGLPLLGVILAGFPVHRYLEFPPHSRYVLHAPFSWWVFTGYAVIIISVVVPLIFIGFKFRRRIRIKPVHLYAFPWWGWLGGVTGIAAWVLAWTRFPWFVKFQPHTFTPLWLSYILVMNAICQKRTGRCMMTDCTGLFLLLFPVSSGFWWFFEYLNRFVQNWFYAGVHFDAWQYFGYATLSFSTVLPAVLGTRDVMNTFSWIQPAFDNMTPFKCPQPKLLAGSAIVLSGIGLAGIGVWPNYLFSLLWVSPLIIIVSLQSLMGERHTLSEMAAGRWSPVLSSAVAALFCGFFWEMWNYYSLARWEYGIPFVNRFKIFEMPILGYAGYLPFGLECVVIEELVKQWINNLNPSKSRFSRQRYRL